MNPWVAVAALAAALPPVLFWGRVFFNARRRVKEDERREQDRQVRMVPLLTKLSYTWWEICCKEVVPWAHAGCVIRAPVALHNDTFRNLMPIEITSSC